MKLEAHHANIKDQMFNVQWFKGFDIVFNALDNLDARRHVNKMCLAADVPLVESGTTGFNGQVQTIKKVCVFGFVGDRMNQPVEVYNIHRVKRNAMIAQ